MDAAVFGQRSGLRGWFWGGLVSADARAPETARVMAALARTWEAKQLVVSPSDISYMSPEALRGEPVDCRSLVFTLGVLLFERVAGQHPFGRSLRTRLDRMQRGKLGSGVSLFVRVPRLLRPVLLRALAADPEERYPTLAALAEALECAAAGGRAAGRSVDRTQEVPDAELRAARMHEEELARERARRRRRALLLTLASVIMLASAVTVWLAAR